MPLYFAYGSNMDRAAMQRRCPASRPLGPARLPRHGFVLTPAGYASIAADGDRTIHGLIWELALRDVAALDRYEGIGEGLYEKSYRLVVTSHGARRALLYVAAGGAQGMAEPGYLEAIIAAAEDLSLPALYVSELRSLLARRQEPIRQTASVMPGS
jgi:gamma-glutamylcyclotransferase (GGCT)/AIG2-like uncharacterized protein YtfP